MRSPILPSATTRSTRCSYPVISAMPPVRWRTGKYRSAGFSIRRSLARLGIACGVSRFAAVLRGQRAAPCRDRRSFRDQCVIFGAGGNVHLRSGRRYARHAARRVRGISPSPRHAPAQGARRYPHCRLARALSGDDLGHGLACHDCLYSAASGEQERESGIFRRAQSRRHPFYRRGRVLYSRPRRVQHIGRRARRRQHAFSSGNGSPRSIFSLRSLLPRFCRWA